MKWPIVSFTAVVNVLDSLQAQLCRCPTIYYSRRRKTRMASTTQELLSSQLLQELSQMKPNVFGFKLIGGPPCPCCYHCVRHPLSPQITAVSRNVPCFSACRDLRGQSFQDSFAQAARQSEWGHRRSSSGPHTLCKTGRKTAFSLSTMSRFGFIVESAVKDRDARFIII